MLFLLRKIGLLLAVSITARAQLQLPEVWQSGMVLQRNMPVQLWGKAGAYQKVTAVLGQEKRTAQANAGGRWRLQFSPRETSVLPQTLTLFSGKDTLTLSDLLIGDVWICAGQSNMAFAVSGDRHAAQTLASTHNPQLRLFNRLIALSVYNQPYQVADTARLHPEHFYQAARWQAADSLSARYFSACLLYTSPSPRD